jgi:hypothetical protein
MTPAEVAATFPPIPAALADHIAALLIVERVAA